MARNKATGARKKKAGGSKGRSRSAITGRYVSKATAKRHPKTTVTESKAGQFADRFIEQHPDTFHELSKR